MQLPAISAIMAMVAPVVLITAAAILAGGILSMYGVVNDRMRSMSRELRDILTGADGTFVDPGQVPPSSRERLTELDHQLPMLVRRHRLLHDSAMLIFTGLAVLVMSVIAIAVAVTSHSDPVGYAGLSLVLAGTVVVLAGIVVAGRSLQISTNAVEWEVSRTLSLRARD